METLSVNWTEEIRSGTLTVRVAFGRYLIRESIYG